MLRTDGNKIYAPSAPGEGKEKKEIELINIPGLWIQDCSFKNLEEGKKILKMYHAIL
jgi:hypothetical protein